MSYSKKVKEQFINLRAQGLSFDKISSEIGVSKPILIKWAQEYGKQIAAAEYARGQELMAQFHLNRQSVLEDSVIELDRVRKAVKARDLGKESIKALLDMQADLEEKVTAILDERRSSAGLNDNGVKGTLTPEMVDEISYKVLGVPLPESAVKKKNDIIQQAAY